MKKIKKAQSIVEYTLLLGAIIGAIVFTLVKPNGIRDKVEKTYDSIGVAIESTTEAVSLGHFQ